MVEGNTEEERGKRDRKKGGARNGLDRDKW